MRLSRGSLILSESYLHVNFLRLFVIGNEHLWAVHTCQCLTASDPLVVIARRLVSQVCNLGITSTERGSTELAQCCDKAITIDVIHRAFLTHLGKSTNADAAHATAEASHNAVLDASVQRRIPCVDVA